MRKLPVFLVVSSLMMVSVAQAQGSQRHHHRKHHHHHHALVHKASAEDPQVQTTEVTPAQEAWETVEVTPAEWDQTTRELEVPQPPVEEAKILTPAEEAEWDAATPAEDG